MLRHTQEQVITGISRLPSENSLVDRFHALGRIAGTKIGGAQETPVIRVLRFFVSQFLQQFYGF